MPKICNFRAFKNVTPDLGLILSLFPQGNFNLVMPGKKLFPTTIFHRFLCFPIIVQLLLMFLNCFYNFKFQFQIKPKICTKIWANASEWYQIHILQNNDWNIRSDSIEKIVLNSRNLKREREKWSLMNEARNSGRKCNVNLSLKNAFERCVRDSEKAKLVNSRVSNLNEYNGKKTTYNRLHSSIN